MAAAGQHHRSVHSWPGALRFLFTREPGNTTATSARIAAVGRGGNVLVYTSRTHRKPRVAVETIRPLELPLDRHARVMGGNLHKLLKLQR